MKKIILPYAIIVFILFAVLNLSAQKKIDYNDLESYIEKATQSFETPGIAVGIYKNGEIVLNKGFGFVNTETKQKVDNETIFGIASCTKAFTAACMAILVDEGKLKWSDKVIDHLPDFQLYDPYITRELRIDDLLSHRSGLITFDGDLLWYGSDYDRKEIIRRIRFRENEYSFRESYGYQNVMFIVAGEVIEKVSGKTWDEFVTERIFQPLDMQSISTTNTRFTEEMNIAYPHINGIPLEFINYDNCGPAASINTSTNDLLKWVQLMLNKGIYNNDTIFSSQQYYKLTQPHTLLNAGPGEKINEAHFLTYGLGWFMYDYYGRKVIQHGGGLPGFHSKVVFVAEDSLGYVIIANQLSGLVEALHKKILEIHLTDSDTDWAALYLEYTVKNKEREKVKIKEKNDQRKQGTEPSLNLDQYVGLYEDKMYGKAEVSINDSILHLKLLPAQKLFIADLSHWHYNTFNFKFNDEFLPEGYLSFILDGNGKPEYFTIELDNPDFHFYKLKLIKTD
jgi:CubicO group peptidase (beta-lactamase class C family)